MLPKKLQKKIDDRKASNSFRELGKHNNLIDFSSNDYLGFSTSKEIYNASNLLLKDTNLEQNGATGSRLLTGNHPLYKRAEDFISTFHKAEATLIFNSGYDANIGFFSSVPQRGDLIFYDELSHASIRDGIQMSNAKTYKFKHNDIDDLKRLIEKTTITSPLQGEMPIGRGGHSLEQPIYIVTESVFSMDGDVPDLVALVNFCTENGFYLIVDEAHALGVFGDNGSGLVQQLHLENKVFARIVTFGKAMGCHGAAVLGSQELIDYLLNFARSFIYTTALPPHSVATILAAYQNLESSKNQELLQATIQFFQKKCTELNIQDRFIKSESAIHTLIIPGNKEVKNASTTLKKEGFDVKPILSPTVPKNKERLRICLHSFNTEREIEKLVQVLATFV